MKLASIFIIVLPAVTLNTLAATLTVFGIINPDMTVLTTAIPTPFATDIISPIGTDANGETTYAIDEVWSVAGEIKFTPTTVDGVVTKTAYTTILSTHRPYTLHETIVADSTHYAFHEDPNPTINLLGVSTDCVLDGTTGSCVEELIDPSHYTQTTTWPGIVVPAFTAVESNAASTTSPQPNGSASRSWLLNEARFVLGIIMAGLLSGWLLVL